MNMEELKSIADKIKNGTAIDEEKLMYLQSFNQLLKELGNAFEEAAIPSSQQ